MIVESHWRRLKHDYLHRFNRPRIDLVIWVLTSRSIPQGLDKMKAIQNNDFWKGVASWRKCFQKEWKSCWNKELTPDSLTNNHTSPSTWTCGCKSFLLSRFLICKHIVHCYEDIEDPFKFFRCVQRNRSSPFWVDRQQLVLRPEFRESHNAVSENTDEESVLDMISDSFW